MKDLENIENTPTNMASSITVEVNYKALLAVEGYSNIITSIYGLGFWTYVLHLSLHFLQKNVVETYVAMYVFFYSQDLALLNNGAYP